MSSSDATRAGPELPPVDVRLVAPETRYEIDDGVLIHVPPADEAHGTRHSKISALVEAHAGPEFDVASDMLTRTSETGDMAPDVSVFPRARDPETGGRQLEQLAFEVVSTESLSHAGRKASQLVARGVRRVFAIDVDRARALEWSASLGTWGMLDPSAYIEDPALAASLSVEALVRVAKVDDAIARALLLKRNPVFEAARAQARADGAREGLVRGKAEGLADGIVRGKAEGLADGIVRGKAEGLADGIVRGKAEALLVILTANRIALEPADRARILDERDPVRLERWIARAATCTEIAELFAEP